MHFAERLWFKSTRSNNDQGCVEVALTSEAVGVRDTKDRDGGTLVVAPHSWEAFTAAVKGDGFGR